MSSLTILDQTINVVNGLFSLNDLHKASGGENKHKPSYFMSNQETQELITEIESDNQIAYHTKQGKQGGTYACRELVIRYGMWISPKFSLDVIRAFDNLNTGAIPCLHKTTVDDRTPLRQAVSLLVGKKGFGYDEAYGIVHQYMGVSHIDEIALDDLPKAISYVHNLVCGSNRPFIQNILADNAHQNRKAQDELSQIIASIGHALEHVKQMQRRLGKQERLIGTLTAQL